MTYAASLDNIPDEIVESDRYKMINCDINDHDYLYSVVSNGINYVVNFAAETHVDNSITDSTPFIHTNISGTHSLLNLLHNCEIDRYVQISTDEVYGSLEESSKPFTETSPIQPNSPYSASKASGDLLCRSFYETYGHPIIITRCSNNYGPNQNKEKLIPLMIDRVKRDEKVPVYGTGKNIRDWIHVDDHCSAIDAVLHKGTSGEVYNIGGNNELRNIDIVKIILNKLGVNEDCIEYVDDRPGHDWRYAIDNTKINNELGWSPSINFEAGINTIIHG